MQDFLLWLDEKLSTLPNGVNGAVHSVSQCLGTGKDLKIITSLQDQTSEKPDGIVCILLRYQC